MSEGATRERVYYVFDTVQQKNVNKYLDLFEAQNNARKRNKDESEKRYVARGAWLLHKL